MPKKSKKPFANKLMPDREHERTLLRKRAINLASKQQVKNNVSSEMFLHIYLGNNEHYGIPYSYLDEILRPRHITPIPSSAKIIAGVIPYRGELVSVLDLAQMLEISQTTKNERIKNSWLVIVSINQVHIALLVNEVYGNYHYQAEELSRSLNSLSMNMQSTNNALGKQVDPVQGIFNGKIAILDLLILLSTFHLNLEKNR